ncbi:MAG: phosphomannomutase/phosphoglucomutase [Nitrospirota bacterium]
MTTTFNPEIFREYDIRGIADRDLTDPVIERLGRAFARYLQPAGINTVTVGYDARLSSPRLRDALTSGLTAAGIDVIDVGLCPTPALYFSLYHLKPRGGIMITGSHNPAEFNGFKLCVGKDTIYGEEIQKLRRIMEDLQTADGRQQTAGRSGKISQHPIVPHYAEHLKGLFREYRDVPIKVVLDSGNGTAGLAAPGIIRSMGCDVTELYSEPDGRFPNHHPDPTIPMNLETLISTVKRESADFGVAFDGDSDRIGIVDEQGTVLWGDQLMVLFSRDILADRPGAMFVSEVKCSQTMYDDIRKHGGSAIMWKTGHSLIKAKMKETGAALAGEMSGHIFFADRYFGFDDAIYAACRVVELLKKTRSEKRSRIPLSSLLADLPKTFNTPEIRFDCPDALKFKVVEQVQQIYAAPGTVSLPIREVITVDGIRAVFEKGWGLIRASNTQPVLVMRFEAVDRASLQAIRALMEEQVRKVIADLS